MELRVLLAAADPAERRRYREEVENLGARCEAFASLREVVLSLCQSPCQGILLDVPTLIRSSPAEKAIARDLADRFPVIRVRLGAGGAQVRTLLSGGGGPVSLREFLDEHCRPFPSRLLRGSPRVSLHLNVLLSPSPQVDPAVAERSVTLNVSRGGCFLFSAREWPEPSVWLDFLDLDDRTPIHGEVRWRAPWGKALRLPGLGVRFLVISARQRDELERLLGNLAPPASSECP